MVTHPAPAQHILPGLEIGGDLDGVHHLHIVVPVSAAPADGVVAGAVPRRGLVVGRAARLRLFAHRFEGRAVHEPFIHAAEAQQRSIRPAQTQREEGKRWVLRVRDRVLAPDGVSRADLVAVDFPALLG